MIFAVTSNRLWLLVMTFRSWFGTIPKIFKTWSNIWRCCAVTQILDSNLAFFSTSFISGAILIASGRVPNIKRIFFDIILSNYTMPS